MRAKNRTQLRGGPVSINEMICYRHFLRIDILKHELHVHFLIILLIDKCQNNVLGLTQIVWEGTKYEHITRIKNAQTTHFPNTMTWILDIQFLVMNNAGESAVAALDSFQNCLYDKG